MNFLRIIVAMTAALAVSTCATLLKRKGIIYPTEPEFAEFEKAVGMTSDEARELVRESWKTQVRRTPHVTGERLVIYDWFFFSIGPRRKLKMEPISLTGYYVHPRTREVRYEERCLQSVPGP